MFILSEELIRLSYTEEVACYQVSILGSPPSTIYCDRPTGVTRCRGISTSWFYLLGFMLVD